MGIMTNNLQQINRSIQTQNEQKITQKESKKNFETFIFFEIWQTFAKSNDIEKTFLYFKDTTTTKKYIEKHENIKQSENDSYINILNFDNLTITEKLQIYNKVLNSIYKQFQYKIKYLNYEPIPEEEPPKKQKRFNKICTLIIYTFIGFISSLLIGKHKTHKKYKI